MTPDETRDFLTEMFGQIGDRFDGIERDIGEIKTDVNDLKTDVGQLKTDVGQLKTDVGQLKTDVRRLEGKVDQVVRENGVLIDAVADINRRLG